MSARRIAILTCTRAEYGLLRSVYFALRNNGCGPLLYVAGTHVSEAHGATIDEIVADGIVPAATIGFGEDAADGLEAVGARMGCALQRFAAVFAEQRPDILVLLGDRYETLSAAAAAALCHVPVAHLHGGEITEGAFDDGFRHAITKLSHLHFTATETARRRVVQMGEDPALVFCAGAVGVENALTRGRLSEEDVRAHFHLSASRPYILATFHPVTLEPGQALSQLHEILAALEAFPEYFVVFTGANADPEGLAVNDALQHAAASLPRQFGFFHSLGQDRYLSSARYAACVLGNSSSGIVEIPSLKTPVLDIGNRQRGRERSAAVLHCAPERAAVAAMLRQCLSPAHKSFAFRAENPYEKCDSSERIAHVLVTFPLTGIQMKHFYALAQGDTAP